MHTRFLQVDGGKMSKSAGEFLRVQSLIERGYDPLVYRYLCLTAHYRTQMSFSWDAMDAATTALDRMRHGLHALRDEPAASPSTEHLQRFTAQIDDDLNLPRALAVAWDALRGDLAPGAKRATLLRFDDVPAREILVGESGSPNVTARAGTWARATDGISGNSTRLRPVAGRTPSERGGAPSGSIHNSSVWPGGTGATPTALTSTPRSPRRMVAISAVVRWGGGDHHQRLLVRGGRSGVPSGRRRTPRWSRYSPPPASATPAGGSTMARGRRALQSRRRRRAITFHTRGSRDGRHALSASGSSRSSQPRMVAAMTVSVRAMVASCDRGRAESVPST